MLRPVRRDGDAELRERNEVMSINSDREATYWNKCPRCGKFADKVETNYKAHTRRYIHDADNVCVVRKPVYAIDLLQGSIDDALASLERVTKAQQQRKVQRKRKHC